MKAPIRVISYITAIDEFEYLHDSIIFLQKNLSSEIPRISLADLDLDTEDLNKRIGIRKIFN